MRLVFALFGVVVAVLLTVAMLFTAGWGHPPIVGTQIGFRGDRHLDHVTTSAAVERLEALNALPDQIPKASPDGPRAKRRLQERAGADGSQRRPVQHADGCDDHLGCSPAGLRILPQHGKSRDDSVYAKKVARRMI